MWVQARKSLAALREEVPELATLAEDARFDMGRLVTADDPELAIKFAYLEHLIRTTTPEDEARNALALMPIELAECLEALFVCRGELFQEAFAVLERNVTAKELEDMLVPDIALQLFFVNQSTVTEKHVLAPGFHRLPVIYIAVLDVHCLILYSSYMTLVDGYSPTTGARSNPMLSGEMIEALRRELYWMGEPQEEATVAEHPPSISTPIDSSEDAAPPLPEVPDRPPPRMRSLVVELRHYDHRKLQQKPLRESCAGMSCCLQ